MNNRNDWITRAFEDRSGTPPDPLAGAEFATVTETLLRLHDAVIAPETEPITTPDLTTLDGGEEDHD